MLAGTVVLERRIRRRRRGFAVELVETRRMRAALQISDRVARLGEHARGRRHMPRLPRMARAEQRSLRGAEIEAPDAVRRDERHRLERLQGAPRHRQAMRIAGGVQETARAIDDGDRSHVHAVDSVPAHHDRERGMARTGRREGQAPVARSKERTGRTCRAWRRPGPPLSPAFGRARTGFARARRDPRWS